jgi:plasmid stability protein
MQILKPAPPAPKEPTTRFTADMPLDLHRRLSVAAAKAGKSKVDLVREILNHVLPIEQ